MASRLQQRRATAAEWAAANPILADGEIGFERDTKVIKVGDGVTRWNVLGLPNAADAVPKSLVDAKGDLLVGSADNTVKRLPGGTTGQVLTADTTTETGLKWGRSPVGTYELWSNLYIEIETLGANTSSNSLYLVDMGSPTDVKAYEFFGASNSYPAGFYAKYLLAQDYMYIKDGLGNARLGANNSQYFQANNDPRAGNVPVAPSGNMSLIQFYVEIVSGVARLRVRPHNRNTSGSATIGGFNIGIVIER